jgi:site-specific recombinase XerD
MKPKRPNLLASLLRNFFCDHLPILRGMSPNTIKSYRDSLVLLLRFLASHKNRQISSLDLEDMGHQDIKTFLAYLESNRKNRASTRNIRLAAFHSFFRFVAAQHPDRLEYAQRILGIPFKKTDTKVVDYLEYEEIREILSTVDRNTPKGQRDYTLLAAMFNTGARVQEILDLRACDLQLTKPFQVKLMGKGRKERCCPIWPQTAQLLRNLCMELNIEPNSEERIFRNCRGIPLSRFGVHYILKMCLKHAQTSTDSLRSKRLHPHSMRHSNAVALLRSGVDLTTIGQSLGHSDPKTTNLYAVIDLEMKRKAIESVKPLKSRETCTPLWRRDKTVIEWLESL